MQTIQKTSESSKVLNQKFYDVTLAVFVGLLLISNIAATKQIQVSALVFDGGALLFPFTYIIGDVLSEVYGFKKTRKAIIVAFAMAAVATATFLIIDSLPATESSVDFAASFHDVTGFVPRIVAASLIAYISGQLLNSFVLVKIKEKTGEKLLWLRLIGSTLAGEFADTLIFCSVAFLGVMSSDEFLNYIITGYFYKCLLEVIILPITYRVIAWYKEELNLSDIDSNLQ